VVAWPTLGLRFQLHEPKAFGHTIHSSGSEVSLPECSDDLEEDQERGHEHEPIADSVYLAPIMEGQPIDRQQQNTSNQHENPINLCHIYAP